MAIRNEVTLVMTVAEVAKLSELDKLTKALDPIDKKLDEAATAQKRLNEATRGQTKVLQEQTNAIKQHAAAQKQDNDATNAAAKAPPRPVTPRAAPAPRGTPVGAAAGAAPAPNSREARRLAELARREAIAAKTPVPPQVQARALADTDRTPAPVPDQGAVNKLAELRKQYAEWAKEDSQFYSPGQKGYRAKAALREAAESPDRKRASDTDQMKALKEGGAARDKAIFRDMDFEGTTPKIKEMHRELIVVNADLERYTAELKELKALMASGAVDESPYMDLAEGIDHVTGKVKEYAGYVDLVTKNINELEDAEKKLIARQATKEKLEAARARAAATRENGPSGGFIEMGYKADKIFNDELYAQEERDEAARTKQQKSHPTKELSPENAAKRDGLDAMRAEKQKEFDDQLLEQAGLAEENQTAHAKAAREQLKLQEMVLMKHVNTNEEIEEQIRLVNLAKEAAQDEAQARKDAGAKQVAVEEKLRAARGQIRVPDDLAKIREYEEREPHKYGPYLNQKAARDAMQPPPAPPPPPDDDDDDDGDSKRHKAALQEQAKEKQLQVAIDRERLNLQARLAVAGEAEGKELRERLAVLSKMEQQQASLAALKNAEFQASEKVIAAQREAVALEAQLENAATEKGQEQRAQLALLRVEEQQQAKLAALLSQQYVEGEQIIAGEKEKIALRAKLETATEAEGAAIRQQLANLSALEQQQAKLAALKNAEFQASEKVIAAQREAVALEAQLENAATEKGQEQRAQLALLRTEEQQQAKLAALLSQQYVEGEQIIAGEKEKIALRAKLETATEAEGAEIRQQLAVIAKIEQQRAQAVVMANEEYHAREQALDLDRQKLALVNRLENATSEETAEIQKQLALLDKVRQQEVSLKLLADQQFQAQEKEIAAQKQVLALETKLRTATAAETADIQQQLALLDKQRQQRAEIAALSDKQYRDEQQKLAVLRSEQQLANQIAQSRAKLNNPALIAQERERLRLQEQIKNAVKGEASVAERLKGIWSSFGAMIGPLSAGLQTGISIAWYLKGALDIIKQGGLANEIDKVTDSLGRLDEAKGIMDASGGLMGKKAAQQADFRGTDKGFRGNENIEVAGIAKAAAQFRVMTGEADDLASAMTEAMKGAQDEIRSGQIGETLKAAGVHQATYNQQLARAASQRGVLVESLDAQTRASLLLSRASDDATGRLTNLRMKGLEGVAQLENFGADLKNKLAAELSKASGFDEQLGVNAARAKLTETQANFSGGGSILQGTKQGSSSAADVERAKKELAEAEAASKTARQNQLKETLLTDVTAGGRQAMQAGGVENLIATRAVLQDIVNLKDNEANFTDATYENMANIAETQIFYNQKLMEAAQTSGVINVEAANLIKNTLERGQVVEVIKKLEAEMLGIQTEETANKANFLKYQIASNKALTESEKLEMTKKQIQLEGQAASLAYAQSQGKSFNEAQRMLTGERIMRIDMLAAQGASLKVSEAQSRLLSQDAKDWNEAYIAVNKLRSDMTGLSSMTQTYRMNVGQVAGGELFAKIGDHIGLASDKMRVFGTILGQAAGLMDGLLGGALLTDKALAWVFKFKPDAKKEPPKGAGRAKEDDGLLEQLRRERIARYIEEQSRYHEVRRHYDDAAISLDAAFTDLHITEEQKRHEASLTSLGNTGKEFRKLYGEGGTFSKELDAALMELEWWHLDTEKRAGKSKEKLAAVEQAWREKMTMMAKDQLDRQAEYVKGHYETIKTAALQYADEIAAKWQEKLDAAAADARAAQEENMFAGSRVGLLGGSLFQASEGEDAEARLGASAGERAMSAAEIAKIKEHSLLTKTYNEKIESTFYNEQQIANIKAKFLRESSQLEIDLMRLGFEESSRLRQEQVASYEAMLAETQELMTHFAEEARSTAEAGKATFKGGLSDTGDSIALSADIGMATGIGFLNVIDQIDKAQVQYTENRKKMNGADQEGYGAIMKGVGGVIGAAGKAADGIIKNERYKAGIKGAVHTAEAIGDYASGNILGGTMHALAAAKFFAIAATATGGGGAAEAKKNEATKRTALSNNTVAFSRDRGPSVMMQVFIELQPLTGKSIVKTMNRDAPSSRGVALDGRWTRPTASVRTDV